MNAFSLNLELDLNSDSDMTRFRAALPESKKALAFGNYRALHGIEAAMPLFKDIQFKWVAGSKNPVGDIMSWNIFSKEAAELIRSMNSDCEIYEQIDIEGVSAYFISFKRVPKLDDDLDIYSSKKYDDGLVTSLTFKKAWEAAGFLGAEFKQIYTGVT